MPDPLAFASHFVQLLMFLRNALTWKVARNLLWYWFCVEAIQLAYACVRYQSIRWPIHERRSDVRHRFMSFSEKHARFAKRINYDRCSSDGVGDDTTKMHKWTEIGRNCYSLFVGNNERAINMRTVRLISTNFEGTIECSGHVIELRCIRDIADALYKFINVCIYRVAQKWHHFCTP